MVRQAKKRRTALRRKRKRARKQKRNAMSGGGKSESLRLHFSGYSLEPETKFLTNEKTMNAILAAIEGGAPFIPRPIQRDERTNVYYDTNGFRLYRLGFECRGRKATDGNGYRHDLKTPDDPKDGQIGPDREGNFLRREYNSVSQDMAPELREFKTGGIDKILEPIEDRELVPWVKGYFKRKRFTFSPTNFPDSKVEIAFENGYYQTTNNRHTSEEMWIIELELKEGRVEALTSVAKALKDRYGLEVCPKTKGEMGLEFAREFMDDEHQAKFDRSAAERLPRYSALRKEAE